MTPARARNLDRLLAPRQIAFIGGTDAAVAIGQARRRGFTGAFWAVNPHRRELAGIPCVSTPEDLPGPPDAVFLAIPAAAVPDMMARLAAIGAGGVVCYSGGFREAGPEGAARERALKAATGDIALVGPNCYGVINYVANAALWPFDHGGDGPGWGAAILTQSGMLSSDITMSQRSLPLAYMVSAGNQTVLGLEDFVAAFAKKPEVRAIGLHIEGLEDIPKFERATLTALRRGVPVVALKTGTSSVGAALTVSHTGSLAGARELYDALFHRLGVIPVESPAQLIETLKYLCLAGPPAGPRVAGFTCSGGGATMVADHAQRIGLAFPPPDAEARPDLTALLPEMATVSNPLDYTTPIWGQPARTGPVFARAMARPDIDAAILVQDYPPTGLDETWPLYANDARAFGAGACARGIPAAVVATIPENLDARTRDMLIAEGIAPMQGLHEALNAIRDGARWSADRARIMADPPAPIMAGPVPVSARLLDEAAGKAWLRACGIPVPEGAVSGADDAPEAAARIGFPVALKALSAELAHKTEAGAVSLGLTSTDAVRDAVMAMRASLAANRPGLQPKRFLIERMAPAPVAELIVGIRRDPAFGLVMTLGSGGVLAELVADVETLLLPAGPAAIRDALGRLRVMRLLAGHRGRPGANLALLVECLATLAGHSIADRGLAEIEINPLFVHETQVTAVDALLTAAAAEAGETTALRAPKALGPAE